MSSEVEIVTFAPELHFREAVTRRFIEVKAKLETLLGDAEIHHVGSTAIPGSLTKGDLDIQVRVSTERFASARAQLQHVYPVNAGGFEVDAMSFEDGSGVPSVGIHLTIAGGRGDLQVRFRDLLLSSESLRREYDDLKRNFQGRAMEAYRTAKAAFISNALAR